MATKKSDVDVASLTIKNLIAHDIPKRMAADELTDFELSQAVPKLPRPTLDFFRGRLKVTLTKRGQLVDPNPKLNKPPLPPVLQAWLADSKVDVVDVSQEAAKHLYSVQTGSASEGLLAVSAATIDGRRALALMKLPHEEGLSVTQTNVGGKPTLNVEVLGNLTLTENTRVFKAGVFWLDDGAMLGLVSDDQTGEATDIAGFFLTNFLGCRRVRQPKVLTKAFKEAVTEYISKNVTDEDDKLQYTYALYAELRSNAKKIDPTKFVSEHVGDDHKAPLLEALKQRGVPAAAFVKDTEMLPRGGRAARLQTEGGLTISGDAEAIERVESHDDVDGEHAIVIRDRVKSVK